MRYARSIAVVTIAAVVGVVAIRARRHAERGSTSTTNPPTEPARERDPRGIRVVVRDRKSRLVRSFVEFGPYRRGAHEGDLLRSDTCSYADEGETWLPVPTEPTIVCAYLNGYCELGPLLLGECSSVALLDPAHLLDTLTLEVDSLTRVNFLIADAVSPEAHVEIEDEIGLIEAGSSVGEPRMPSLSIPRGRYTARLVAPNGVTLSERAIVVEAEPVWVVMTP